MRLTACKYLRDIQDAITRLEEFTHARDYSDYELDAMLRSAVERQFEINGEAMRLLSRAAPEIAARISSYEEIIAFCNVLIHGYADIDNGLVWNVVLTGLPILSDEVDLIVEQECPPELLGDVQEGD